MSTASLLVAAPADLYQARMQMAVSPGWRLFQRRRAGIGAHE
jgi:hypothetical protein